MHKITILSAPGCSLCEKAKEAINKLVANHMDILVEVVNIQEQPDLHAKYMHEIPVIMVDDVERFRHTVDTQALARIFYDELGQKLIGF